MDAATARFAHGMHLFGEENGNEKTVFDDLDADRGIVCFHGLR